MSLYCIGDLHGRYDLFIMALEKINFDNVKDKMYILGDVIDVNCGAIKILRYIMQYQNSFELILGNHEDHFKDMEMSYDVFMLNDNIKQKVKDVMDNYFDAYDNIADLIIKIIKSKDISLIKSNSEIIKWLKPSKKRVLLLEAIIILIEYLDYDEDKFKQIMWVLSNTNCIFKTKQFVKELLELDSKEYVSLKKYIFSKSYEIKFTYFDKEFWLVHALPNYRRYCLQHIPDMQTKNQYVVFGHDPVVKIHREVSDKNFDFNYREIFSYIDRFNNHYYNLDMTSNAAAVLRIDDFEEFYVMKYKKEPENQVKPPIEPVNERKVGYKIVDSDLPVYTSKKGFSFVTYKDYCMEYLIGVNKFKKKIYYKRISYMYANKIEIVEDWYDNQSIEVIIEKVKEDDNSKKDTDEIISMEKYVRGINNY